MTVTKLVDRGDKDLSRLLRRVKSLPKGHIEPSILGSLRIASTDLVVDESNTDSKLNFCSPIPDKEFDNIYDSTEKSLREFPPRLAHEILSRSDQMASILETAFLEVNGQYCPVEVNGEYDFVIRSMWQGLGGRTKSYKMPFERYSLWQVKRLIQPIIRSFPYRACILTDNAIGDDRLRRCELLVALHMMRETLRLPKYYEYQTIPTFLYTAFANGVRIVHLHWDGKQLIVRKSRILDIAGKETDLKISLRWMMSRLLLSPKTKTRINKWKRDENLKRPPAFLLKNISEEDELAAQLQSDLRMPSKSHDDMDIAI